MKLEVDANAKIVGYKWLKLKICGEKVTKFVKVVKLSPDLT